MWLPSLSQSQGLHASARRIPLKQVQTWPLQSGQLGRARGGQLYLEGFQEGVEVDEDNSGDLVLPRVDEEQHVGDAQEGQQHQCGLHSLPGMGGVGPESQATQKGQALAP